jgi:hypothetical protein
MSRLWNPGGLLTAAGLGLLLISFLAGPSKTTSLPGGPDIDAGPITVQSGTYVSWHKPIWPLSLGGVFVALFGFALARGTAKKSAKFCPPPVSRVTLDDEAAKPNAESPERGNGGPGT